jgi:16S rRNA (guanine(966)-N(2))-methyltransferase RsmD
MRITSGKYKGRVIKMPSGIRPTQDKVRKALFDILGDIEGLSFLELFAGSGAVGFEALSRKAAELVLVENNRNCLSVIKQNIEALKIENCSLYPQEAEKSIRLFHKNKKVFDIIFLDPPYYKEEAKKTLQIFGAYDILAPYGLVIAQHFKKDKLPSQSEKLELFKEAAYGDTVLSFYKKR